MAGYSATYPEVYPAPSLGAQPPPPPPGSASQYTFVLTTLAGVPVSETPGATSKRLEIPVVGMATSSLQVRGDSPDADFLLAGDALMRIYERRDPATAPVLLGHHRLITAEERAVAGSGHTVSATFADPVWTLLRRLIGKSNSGYSRGTPSTQVDRGLIISELLGAINVEDPTGVRMGVLTASSDTHIEGWFYKPLAEAIADLGATLDGPDWRVRPIEYAAGIYGELDVLASIGQLRPNVAFEFGDGLLNVREYSRTVSLEGTANRIYSLPAGFPDNAVGGVLAVENGQSRTARRMLESVVPTDLTVDALRLALLDAHLAARKGPRQTISFDLVRDLAGRAPRFGVDFNVGDRFAFRSSVTRAGKIVKRLDVIVRAYGYSVTVDDAGYGTPSLNTTPA